MNMIKKYTGRSLLLAGLVLTSLITGCNSSSGTTTGTGTGTAPTVVETAPIKNATAVALNSKVVVTFSEAMDDTTITKDSFTVSDAVGTAPLVGTVSYDATSKTATFTPTINFIDGASITATVTTAVKSATGQTLAAAYDWSFTVGTAADAAVPTVVSTNPLNAAADVVINPRVSATFSEAVHPATVNDSTFTLKAGGTLVSGVVSYSNRVASFTPTDNLVINKDYTATLTTGITDIAKPANALAAAKVWTFTTGSTVAKGPAPVNLRTAAYFSIMTAAGITSAGSTTITGNIGTSPITGASITVACTELSAGEMFTDNAEPVNTCVSTDKGASAIAIGDVGTAYTEAAAAPAGVGPNLNIGAGTVTAQILIPGVYTWGTNVNLTGDITLDGGANDVWIFQVSGTLDLAASKAIVLAGGALAKNVFWQASSTVTLNSGAVFKGNILAKTDIEMISGSHIDGRLLAQTEVRLGTTTVVTAP